MSEIQKIADAVRQFGDQAEGPLALANFLASQIQDLTGQVGSLSGPEVQHMRGALESARTNAQAAVASLESFQRGASNFADRLANGGSAPGGSGGAERLSSSRSPEFEPQPGGTSAGPQHDTTSTLDRSRDASTDVPIGIQIGAARASITAVHGLPPGLPQSSVRAEAMGANGLYRPDEHVVVVDPDGPTPRLTFAHEFGHYLDHVALGTDGSNYATRRPPDPHLNAWLATVLESPSVKELQRVQLDARTSRHDVNHASYLLDPPELWGRAYAQYIATRSADPGMLADVRWYRSRPDPLDAFRQWGHDEFAPIASAIEAILRAKGLLP